MSEPLDLAAEEHAFPLSKNRWVFNVWQEVWEALDIFWAGTDGFSDQLGGTNADGKNPLLFSSIHEKAGASDTLWLCGMSSFHLNKG